LFETSIFSRSGEGSSAFFRTVREAFMIDFLEQLVNCLLAAIFSLVIIGLCAVPVALFIWMVWWLLKVFGVFS
jgi:hypothetical protein